MFWADNNKRWYKDIYNLYLIALGALVALPFLAPIFLHFGIKLPAKYIYFLYSFTCHQFEHRSLHVYDHQCAWCARDTAIWSSVFLISLLVKFNKVKGIKWYWVIPFAIPLTMDGVVQTIFTVLEVDPVGVNTGMPLYISNNFARFLTGTLFGIGLALWVSPTIKNDIFSFNKNIVAISVRKSLSYIFVSFLAMMIFYLGLIGIWSATSKEYEPANAIDSIVRTPKEDFFVRRKTAVCPTTNRDLFNFECFF